MFVESHPHNLFGLGAGNVLNRFRKAFRLFRKFFLKQFERRIGNAVFGFLVGFFVVGIAALAAQNFGCCQFKAQHFAAFETACRCARNQRTVKKTFSLTPDFGQNGFATLAHRFNIIHAVFSVYAKKQPGIGKIPGVKVNNSLRQGGADLFVEKFEHFPEQFLTIGNRH